MLYLKVAFFPKKALGSITINGTLINKGETIQQFGMLRVDVGNYEIEEISVWNNGIKWSSVSVEENVLVFNLQSNGDFFIYENDRNVIFDFSNDMQQNFSIESTNSYSLTDPSRPGIEITKYSYRQDLSHDKSYSTIFWVKSTNLNIRHLPIRGVNCSANIATPIASDVSREWTAIYFKLSDSTANIPAEIYVGNVLVLYIVRVVN